MCIVNLQSLGNQGPDAEHQHILGFKTQPQNCSGFNSEETSNQEHNFSTPALEILRTIKLYLQSKILNKETGYYSHGNINPETFFATPKQKFRIFIFYSWEKLQSMPLGNGNICFSPGISLKYK